MATINYAFKEISCKIVYYGCGLSGKTTNIQHIHQTVPDQYRGDLISLATEQDRTLFFDYLPLDLGQIKEFKTKFQLYTVPGQVYYSATRKLVLRGVDGIVFVVDSGYDRFTENVESLEDLKNNLLDYNYNLDEIPWVLQYNKRDLTRVRTVEEMERVFNDAKVLSFEAIATEGVGVKETLKSIAALVLKKIRITTKEEEKASTIRRSIHPVKMEGGAGPTDEEPHSAQGTSSPEVEVKSTAPDSQTSSADSEQTRLPLNIRQRSDIRWRGIKIGTGTIDLINHNGSAAGNTIKLTGNVRFFYFFKCIWSKRLTHKYEDSKLLENRMVPFDYLETESLLPDNCTIKVWISKHNHKDVYIRIPCLGDELVYLPAGKSEAP